MSDMAGFLTARFGEEEDYCRTMIAVGEDQAADVPLPEAEKMRAVFMSIISDSRTLDLVKRWTDSKVDPPNSLKRLLIEIGAKRKVLAEHQRAEPLLGMAWSPCSTCRAPGSSWPATWPCPTLRAMAAVWRDHPDYDQAWRP